MAYSRTLAELELAVRREADMVNSQFVTSLEVRSYINQSWAQLYDRIVLFDQEYLLRHVDIASTGAGEYDILNAGSTGIIRELRSFTAGAGYSAGSVTLAQGANVSATADITVNGAGNIQTITLTNAGSGYTTTTTAVDTAVLTVTGGAATVTVVLDSDFYKCKGVWMMIGSDSNPLRRFQWEEQNLLRQVSLHGGGAALPFYRVYTVQGRELLSIAPDSLGGTFKVWYYPAPQRMLVDTDRIDGRSGWDEWVVKDTAIKCLLKEESIEQAAGIKAIRDEIWGRFQLYAAERDASQPERIRDVGLLSRRYGVRR